MSAAYILKYHGHEISLLPVCGIMVAIIPPVERQEYPNATAASIAAIDSDMDLKHVKWEPVESAVLTA